VALQLLRVLAGEADLPPGVDELNLRGLLKQIVIKVSGMVPYPGVQGNVTQLSVNAIASL
jgi:hypothetical protein